MMVHCPVCGRAGLHVSLHACPQCNADLECFQLLESLHDATSCQVKSTLNSGPIREASSASEKREQLPFLRPPHTQPHTQPFTQRKRRMLLWLFWLFIGHGFMISFYFYDQWRVQKVAYLSLQAERMELGNQVISLKQQLANFKKVSLEVKEKPCMDSELTAFNSLVPLPTAILPEILLTNQGGLQLRSSQRILSIVAEKP